MSNVPMFFKDIQDGAPFLHDGDIWIKVVQSRYWVLGQDVPDTLRASGVNAICHEPIDKPNLTADYRLLEPDTLVVNII